MHVIKNLVTGVLVFCIAFVALLLLTTFWTHTPCPGLQAFGPRPNIMRFPALVFYWGLLGFFCLLFYAIFYKRLRKRTGLVALVLALAATAPEFTHTVPEHPGLSAEVKNALCVKTTQIGPVFRIKNLTRNEYDVCAKAYRLPTAPAGGDSFSITYISEDMLPDFCLKIVAYVPPDSLKLLKPDTVWQQATRNDSLLLQFEDWET